MVKYSKTELKKLIKSGYDLKLISFELDIPVEQLEQIKTQLEEQQKAKSDNQTQSKMQQMREKYNSLFLASAKVERKVRERIIRGRNRRSK